MDVPKQRALLIGIDRYVYPASWVNRPVGNLQGAINDVLAVEEYLVNKRNMVPGNITKLLAPVPGMTHRLSLPPSRTCEKPTYQNIVDALETLAKESEEDDVVYIHYSGHGVQATTMFPHLRKAGESVDHCIIPCDFSEGGPLLRDVEIGALIQDIVAKDAVVTVVLDSCYSGGAMRGEEAEDDVLVRGHPRVHISHPADDRISQVMTNRINHHAQSSMWMKNPSGFAFLAACSPTETAKEQRVDGHHRHGLLTYWLLHALGQIVFPSPRDIGSETILQLMKSKISEQDQTPALIGDRQRFFFGPEVRPLLNRIFVRQRNEAAQGGGPHEIIINAGAAHLIREGSEYNIMSVHYSGQGGDQTQRSEVVARVRINRVNNFESSGWIAAAGATPDGAPALPRWDEVHPGCPAVLTSMRRGHKFTVQFNPNLNQEEAAELATKTWIRHWEMNEDAREPPSFRVTVDPAGIYAVQRADLPILPRVLSTMTPLSAAEPLHFTTLLNRLERLAQFCTMRTLRTPPGSATSPTPPIFSVDLVPAPKPQDIIVGGQRRTLFPATDIPRRNIGDPYQIRQDRLFSLRLDNFADQELGFVVLNFTPEFGVQCVFPFEDNAAFVTVPAWQSWTEDLFVQVPERLQNAAAEGTEIVETFKVIACSPAQSFDPLRLPRLWEPEEPSFRGGSEEEDEPPRAICVKTMQRGMLASQTLSGWQVVDIPIRIMP